MNNTPEHATHAGGRPAPLASSTLGRDTSVEGSISFVGELLVEGTVRGEIRSEGRLIIGRDSVVHADITCGDVTVNGSVVGNITATERLNLSETANVSGQRITAGRFAMAEGALLDGNLTISPKPRSEGSAAANAGAHRAATA